MSHIKQKLLDEIESSGVTLEQLKMYSDITVKIDPGQSEYDPDTDEDSVKD